MIEIAGDLWEDYEVTNNPYADVYRVITTNGFVKKTGECVMGRGVALDAKQKYPDVPQKLGELILKLGNNVHYIGHGLISFPVKHHWQLPADLELIERSAGQLVALAEELEFTGDCVFLMPRPGCGNGRLFWADVKPLLEKHLDDRFVVVYNGKE